MKKYEILLNSATVGYACIKFCGLFAEISCTCNFQSEGLYRIKMSYIDAELDLGICIPDGEYFTVHKKIPCKCLGNGEPVFCAINTRENQLHYVPITSEAKFPYLAKITSCYFGVRDQQPVLFFKSK